MRAGEADVLVRVKPIWGSTGIERMIFHSKGDRQPPVIVRTHNDLSRTDPFPHVIAVWLLQLLVDCAADLRDQDAVNGSGPSLVGADVPVGDIKYSRCSQRIIVMRNRLRHRNSHGCLRLTRAVASSGIEVVVLKKPMQHN